MLREVHAATVVNVDDPDKRGRLLFKSDTLMPDQTYPLWAEPLFPYVGKEGAGFFFIPDVGTAIEVEVDPDTSEHPEAFWRAALYSAGDPVPEPFKEEYPKKMGIATPSGSFVMFDESEGTQKIFIYSTKDLTLECEHGIITIRGTAGIDVTSPNINLMGRPLRPVELPI